jgi:hypothetical protein
VRVRIENPELLPDLFALLTAGIDAIVDRLNERELEVGLLGSRTEPYARIELEHRLRAFRLQYPRARIAVVPEPLGDEHATAVSGF